MNVRIAWNWSGYASYLDQCELQVDRADGKGFVDLAIGKTLGYADTEPFPSARLRNGPTGPPTTPAATASANGANRWADKVYGTTVAAFWRVDPVQLFFKPTSRVSRASDPLSV